MTKTLRGFLVVTILALGSLTAPPPTLSSTKADLSTTEPATSTIEAPLVQGRDAVFPSVEIVRYVERAGVTPRTRVPLIRVDVTLRVKNKGRIATDPVLLVIKDNNQLMRPMKPILIPSLRPGVGTVISGHLEADVPGDRPTLASTQDWRERYRARCGLQLGSVMEFNGSPAMRPRNGMVERKLKVEAAGSVHLEADPNPSICDTTHCIKPCEMGKEIKRQLDGHVVGYAFFVGRQSNYGSGGKARTSADGVERDFTPTTKITVASVSKLVTALAALRMLQRRELSLDTPIGPYFPSDWSVSDYVKNITFAQLLGHTSGIKDYGNVTTDYAKLKQFFTQSVGDRRPNKCQGYKVIDPPEAINPGDQGRCYSNYNFSIFRILLPQVAGYPEDPDLTTRPRTLANHYESLVRLNVFGRVGQQGVKCKPPTESPGNTSYAFAYRFPGTSAGADWGDESLKCGATSWYLSVEDMAKVLLSVNALDGRILAETHGEHQLDDMMAGGLGVDIYGPRKLEKNGGYGANCDSNGENCAEISTSASIFGPVIGPRLVAVLFMNSNVSGGGADGRSARGVLQTAYDNALTVK